MRRSPLLLLACVWLAPACGWGPLVCTPVDCLDHVSIDLEPALEGVGRFDLQVDLDDRRIRCEIELPSDMHLTPCLEQDGSPSPIRVSHPDGVSISSIWIKEAPRELRVLVELDGIEVAGASFQPRYERYYPNGPDCDGDHHCKSGREVL